MTSHQTHSIRGPGPYYAVSAYGSSPRASHHDTIVTVLRGLPDDECRCRRVNHLHGFTKAHPVAGLRIRSAIPWGLNAIVEILGTNTALAA